MRPGEAVLWNTLQPLILTIWSTMAESAIIERYANPGGASPAVPDGCLGADSPQAGRLGDGDGAGQGGFLRPLGHQKEGCAEGASRGAVPLRVRHENRRVPHEGSSVRR